jgi:hypothetical protein
LVPEDVVADVVAETGDLAGGAAPSPSERHIEAERLLRFEVWVAEFDGEVPVMEPDKEELLQPVLRKARSSHVTNDACFGFRNVDVAGPNGERSHVVWEIEPTHAVIVRTMFRRGAAGHLVKGIAKRLNCEGAVSPRAQQGRSRPCGR